MQIKRVIWYAVITVTFWTCKDDQPEENMEDLAVIEVAKEHFEFGFNFNDFIVKRDTIKSGDTFGVILERNNLGYPKIFHIAEKAKDSFDIRKLQVGKPYTLLCAKDSLETPKSFIYQPNKLEYVVIEFCDTILAYKERKPVTIVEKEASGVITSTLSETMDEQGLSAQLIYDMSDIYAWTIDFFRLQ
mgnify:CR=1 FL=1